MTETALLQNEAIVHSQLADIQKLGVKIALDDFGAAYATLATLRDFHFDKIKIDRSFVGDMPDRKSCAAIVKAVAGLADALDIRSVAEGVETMDQLRQVRASGYTEIQGFYFSVAVPAEKVPEDAQGLPRKARVVEGVTARVRGNCRARSSRVPASSKRRPLTLAQATPSLDLSPEGRGETPRSIQAHRNAGFGHVAPWPSADGVGAEVENGRCEHSTRVSFLYAIDQMIERADAA